MKVKLINSIRSIAEMEYNAAYAMFTCYTNTNELQSEEPATFVKRAIIKRAIKIGHESILEHIILTFEVNDLSRACLQELARHRYTSLIVESTCHTLKKNMQYGDISYWFPTDLPPEFVIAVENYLETLKEFVNECPEIPNDVLKYVIPECVTTNLVLTINVKELRHILKLRTSPAALQEFQNLAHKLFEAVPEDYRYMLE